MAALPQVISKTALKEQEFTSFILLLLSVCLISGIFQRKPGQSLRRWSQHFGVSDRQPRQPHRAAVHTAMGAARWKRIPRSPKRSSEGSGLCEALTHAEHSNHSVWSSAYQLLHFHPPPLVCLYHSCSSSHSPRFPPPSLPCISLSNQYIDRRCRPRLYYSFHLHLIKQWSRKKWILNAI